VRQLSRLSETTSAVPRRRAARAGSLCNGRSSDSTHYVAVPGRQAASGNVSRRRQLPAHTVSLFRSTGRQATHHWSVTISACFVKVR